jgi:hypothetical protein
MRKHNLIPVIALLVTFITISTLQSCTKLAQKLNFSLNMQTQSVDITIPPTGTITNATFGPVTTYYNVDSFIKANTANQLGIANISSVKLASCVLTLHNATSTNNFQNFQSVAASFYSNTDNNPYQMSIDNNPDVFATTLSLPVDPNKEFSSYLGNQFTYSVTGTLRRPTTDSLKCTVTFTYNMVVKG